MPLYRRKGQHTSPQHRHLKRLRKKFKQKDDDFSIIETLYGVGYRFKEI